MRRFVQAILVAALAAVATGSATAATDLPLTVLSETSTTITLGWTAVTGADGYDFLVRGARVSQTRDGTRTSVRFGKISDCLYECYGVEAWQRVELAKGGHPHAPACSNKRDDDGDGKIDYPADPGCSSATDTDETDPVPPPPAPACSDGKDNDGDGFIDYPADKGCTSATDTDETDPAPPGGTITSSECAQRAAVNGAVIENLTVSGGCDVTGDNVTFRNVTVNGSLDMRPSASGTQVLSSRMLQGSIMGADNTLIENSTINCNKQVKDGLIIWDEPAGDYPDGYTLRGNTFENCVDVNAGDHSQAIYNGYARNGLIENNYFYNNGSTAHIFFTWFGNKADPATTYPRDICVRGNTFVNPPGGEFHYYDINFRSEIPTSANIRIDPDQWPNRQTSSSDHRFDADC